MEDDEEQMIVAMRTRMGLDSKDRMVLSMTSEHGLKIEVRVTLPDEDKVSPEDGATQVHDLLHQIPEVFYSVLERAVKGDPEGIMILGGS